ncbi:Transcription regulator HTH, AraC-type [Syntrophomonas zehnderi OL-4]|uniref:Transcription regulator HTH, AraC-type n=2 Tax=Syntrophomonas TaxID=862 RepID=A0A0E4C9R1_9FIRM|nr:Transcription regulator HTH, AraC-type [Syntrophomonas zehnderi OL-4]
MKFFRLSDRLSAGSKRGVEMGAGLDNQKKYFEPSLSHAYFALINEILTGHMNDDKVLLKKWEWLNLRHFPQVVMTAGFIYNQTRDFDVTKHLKMKIILSDLRQIVKYWQGAVVITWYYERMVFLLPLNNLEDVDFKQELLLVAQKVISVLEKDFELQASIGIGNIYNQPSLLYRSFEEACQAQKSYLLTDNPIIFYSDLATYHENETVYPFSEESELLVQIKKGNMNAALKALDKVNQVFQSKNPQDLKDVYLAFYLELLITISRALIFQGADPVLVSERKLQLMTMLGKLDGPQDFIKWSCNMLTLFMGMVNKDEYSGLSECVRNAVIFLQSNFRQAVTLREVAAAVHVNPSYLSRTFKKELGINFSTYLTKLRMENAKSVLENSQENIKSISFESGFKNPSYFHTVFKKNTGISPTKFRNIMGEK